MSILRFKTNHKLTKNDFYQTPSYAVEPLLKYIPKEWSVWDCACGQFNIVNFFRNNGYASEGNDIIIDESADFLLCEYTGYDCIVTNPPFSLKTQFLEVASALGKPFAFLMNLTSLETQRRQVVYKKCGLQLILLDKRVDFETQDGSTSGAWFPTGWFTFGFNLPADIVYETINKK